jgi:NAD(P)-dependent dehydrogenase (short-subunit alcohol dehydrogenase family)
MSSGSDNHWLADRIAVVTGAGTGIGRAVALAFAQAGAAVACLDIDRAGAEETAQAILAASGRALAHGCDVSVEADTLAAAAAVQNAWGGARVLVHAAAADDPTGTIADIRPAEWDRVFAINVKGAYLISRAVLPMMVAAGGGSIILIASQLGRVAAPGRAVYCASKGALIQLAKTMAVDHAGQNIRVNALSPGAVETRRLVRRFGDMEAARQIIGPKHLLARLGRPEEIAEAALFLASEASSFMTGADLLVDGGYTAM